MDPRLVLSLLSTLAAAAVLWRLLVLGVLFRYFSFSVYLLASVLQATIWLAGPRESPAYALFWVISTPLMLGLRVLVTVELWRLLLAHVPGVEQIGRRLAVAVVSVAIAVSLLSGVDLWLIGWRPTMYRSISLAVRYSASILAIVSCLAIWLASSLSAKTPPPPNLVRHGYLWAGYMGSVAAGHLLAHLSGGDTELAGLALMASATSILSLWALLFTANGEEVPAAPDMTPIDVHLAETRRDRILAYLRR